MSLISTPRLALIVLLLLSIQGSSFADTLLLKNGQEVKGEIIQQGADGVVLEYQVTPTIKDQKTYSSNEIAKIIVLSEEEKAFAALGNLTPPPTALVTSFYDPLVDKKIPEFLAAYPYSSHVPELRKTLHSLTEERDHLKAGDRRIDGTWITAAQIAANPYAMQSKIQLNALKEAAAENDPVAALKSYELLEKNYPGSSVIPDAVEIAQAQLDRLRAKLSAVKADFDVLAKKREAWFTTAPQDQVKLMKASLENESLQAKTLMAQAAADGSKFFPIFQNVKDALDQLETLVLAEKERLKLFPLSSMRESIANTEKASLLIDQGNLKEAQSELDAASKAWSANADLAPLGNKLKDASKKSSSAPAIAPH